MKVGALSPRHGSFLGCGEDDLQMWTTAARLLKKQLRTAAKRLPSISGVGWGLTVTHRERYQHVIKSTSFIILFGIRKNCHSGGRNLSLYILIERVIKLTSDYRGISLLPTTYKILPNILVSIFNTIQRRNYWRSSVWISM
jgi:hypothetical protein